MTITNDNKCYFNESHNHLKCIEKAISEALQKCKQTNIKLTELRKDVLKLIWRTHKPLGAYDIIDLLSQKRNQRIAPPTVYRALDFLMKNGFIHKINTLNAYIGCNHALKAHQSQFLICRSCNVAIEMNNISITRSIKENVKKYGFISENQTIEIIGLCQACSLKK